MKILFGLRWFNVLCGIAVLCGAVWFGVFMTRSLAVEQSAHGEEEKVEAEIPADTHGAQTAVVRVGEQSFDVRVAASEMERQRGLMGVTDLCENCGMLFVFSEPGTFPFWMKNTPLSLDIIWIREGIVIYSAERTTPYSEELLTPMGEADMVLEVIGGTVERYGIDQGSTVEVVYDK